MTDFENRQLAKMNVKEIAELLSEIRDYDFIPHFGNGIDHKEVIVENGHLGLCTCLCKSLLIECRAMMKKEDLSEKYFACVFMVLVVPEDITCWNILRKLSTEENVHFLFNLTEMVLLRKPNCGAVLIFREWLLRQSPPDLDRLRSSLELCAEICDRRRSNYVAWDHRRFIYGLLETDNHSSIIELELDRNQLWLETHVSDSSAWSYRIFLLRRRNILRPCRLPSILGDVPLLLVNEAMWALNFLRLFISYECIWNYTRVILQNIKGYAPSPEIEKIEAIVEEINQLAADIGGWSDTLARRFQRTRVSLLQATRKAESFST